ncbi:MAG: hypothetical protein ACI8Q1_000417 [Parvicella sp.]
MPEDITELDMYIFTETPADISDGQTLPFTVSSHSNNLPNSNQAYYEGKFTLDDGLLIQNVITDVKWISNNSNYKPQVKKQ